MKKTFLKVALGALIMCGFAASPASAQVKSNGNQYNQPYTTTSQHYTNRAVIAPPVRQRRIIRIQHPTSHATSRTTMRLITNLQYNPVMNRNAPQRRASQNPQTSRAGMPIMAPRGVKAPMTIIIDRQAPSVR